MHIMEQQRALLDYVRKECDVADYYADNYIFDDTYLGPKGIVVACSPYTFEKIVYYAEIYYPDMKITAMNAATYIERLETQGIVLKNDFCKGDLQNLSVWDFVNLNIEEFFKEQGFLSESQLGKSVWCKNIDLAEEITYTEKESIVFIELDKIKQFFEQLSTIGFLSLQCDKITKSKDGYRIYIKTSCNEITINISFSVKTEYKEYQYIVARKVGNNIYYFDKNDKWCKERVCYPGTATPPMRYFKFWNKMKIKSALAALKPGEDVERFKALYTEISLSHFNDLDRFIGKVKIFVERESENQNKNTFDFVRVFAYTTYTPDEGKRNYIEKNIEQITSYVLDKIAESKAFSKYEVPINILKLSNVTLTVEDDIVFIFEVKEYKE